MGTVKTWLPWVVMVAVAAVAFFAGRGCNDAAIQQRLDQATRYVESLEDSVGRYDGLVSVLTAERDSLAQVLAVADSSRLRDTAASDSALAAITQPVSNYEDLGPDVLALRAAVVYRRRTAGG